MLSWRSTPSPSTAGILLPVEISIRRFAYALAALVASYKGLNPKGGPKGVGDAVNQSVIITFMLLFVVNFVITTIYFQVIPQKAI